MLSTQTFSTAFLGQTMNILLHFKQCKVTKLVKVLPEPAAPASNMPLR